MKKELNIAAILKKKPDVKLWSPIFGGCRFEGIGHTTDKLVHKLVVSTIISNTIYTFGTDGRYVESGEVCLFPSRYMQDWGKFAWKKGDVLYCGVDSVCIFNKWENDEYTEFNAEFVTPNFSGAVLKTKDWAKVTNEDTIKQYISKIEEVKGGKLNLTTLNIEKPKQEFKDGDVVAFDKSVAICRHISEHTIYFYACISKTWGLMINDNSVSCSYRLATDSEKQKLFDALAKENKKWNPDTKQIEDLPKKWEFKAFDKVLVRDTDTGIWMPTLFGFYDKEFCNYVCLNEAYAQCIPYNEETKHLLGTTDEWKGGE